MTKSLKPVVRLVRRGVDKHVEKEIHSWNGQQTGRGKWTVGVQRVVSTAEAGTDISLRV